MLLTPFPWQGMLMGDVLGPFVHTPARCWRSLGLRGRPVT